MLTLGTKLQFLIRSAAVGLLCLTLPFSVSAAPSAGWSALGQNSDTAARTAFRAALQKNPADADALCGLGLTQQQEDDESGAVVTLRHLYAAAPASWQAAALWPQMTTLAGQTGRWDLLEGAAQDVLSAKSTSPSLQASARLALAQSASRSGLAAEAAHQWKMLSYVRRWSIIGPFDNASQSGFDKIYPPEQQIALGSVCTGKDDQPLHWHTLGLIGLDGQCAIGSSLGDTDANVFYAVTAIQSPRVQAALLQFDPSGASKISLNGAWVHVDSLSRVHSDLLADPFVVPVTLQAGWNTILVKLSDDEKLAAALALRITTSNGSTLSLPADPAQAKLAPISPVAAASSPVESVTAALLRRRAPSLETSVLLGETLRAAHDYTASAETLRQSLATMPDCGLLHRLRPASLGAVTNTFRRQSE